MKKRVAMLMYAAVLTLGLTVVPVMASSAPFSPVEVETYTYGLTNCASTRCTSSLCLMTRPASPQRTLSTVAVVTLCWAWSWMALIAI